MKNLLYIISILSVFVLYSSCGNSAAKKEKARQESIKKAEEEAKQKAEQDKKQAWQDLLNACKDEEKDKFIGDYNIRKEFDKKDPLRLLVQQGHIKDNMEMYATLGKRKTESGYILCVVEQFNGVAYGSSKMYDSYTWLFATDEQGNVLDKIKIGEMNCSLKEDSPISLLASYYLQKISKPSEKEVTFTIVRGKTAKGSDVFKGEKISYKLEGGKFKETGRKNETHSTAGRE